MTLLSLWAVSVALPAAAEPTGKGARAEPVVLVNLAPAKAGTGLRAELQAKPGIAVVPADASSVMARALAGDAVTNLDELQHTARAALEQAGAAYGTHDCEAATRAGDTALAALAALEAGGAIVTDDLARAYVYELLCAHQRGDSDAALAAAKRLGRLGVDSPPAGVSPLIWGLYPATDVTTNVMMRELTVTTEPAGATVWIDHGRAGIAPVTVLVSEGRHLVAAAHARAGGVSREITVTADMDAVELAVPAPGEPGAARAAQIAALVAGWQARKRVAAAELGPLLTELGSRFALVMTADNLVELWAFAPGDTEPRRVSVHAMEHGANMAADVLSRARRWDHTGPEPGVELLREPVTARTRVKTSSRQSWWVYAAIVGAVAVTGGIMLAGDLVDDRQRIEIVWP